VEAKRITPELKAKLAAPGDRVAWHAMDPEACLRRLDVDARVGLGHDEARSRLVKHGPNALAEAKRIRPLVILLRQFGSIIVWILIVAALVAGITRQWADCTAILAIVVLNAVIGFYLEYHAKTSIAALRRLTAPQKRVRRAVRPRSSTSPNERPLAAGRSPGEFESRRAEWSVDR